MAEEIKELLTWMKSNDFLYSTASTNIDVMLLGE